MVVSNLSYIKDRVLNATMFQKCFYKSIKPLWTEPEWTEVLIVIPQLTFAVQRGFKLGRGMLF